MTTWISAVSLCRRTVAVRVHQWLHCYSLMESVITTSFDRDRAARLDQKRSTPGRPAAGRRPLRRTPAEQRRALPPRFAAAAAYGRYMSRIKFLANHHAPMWHASPLPAASRFWCITRGVGSVFSCAVSVKLVRTSLKSADRRPQPASLHPTLDSY